MFAVVFLAQGYASSTAVNTVRVALKKHAPVVLALSGLPMDSSGRPARRQKKNKYASFSKADDARKSLRFSNIGQEEEEVEALPEEHVYTQRVRDEYHYPDAAEIDQNEPATFGFTEVGVIVGAHGTRGEVRVRSDSDFAVERLCNTGALWMRRRKRRAPRPVELLGGRKGPGRGNFLVTLADVHTRDEAAVLRGATLHVRRELMPDLAHDEILLWQLERMRVVQALEGGASGNTPPEPGTPMEHASQNASQNESRQSLKEGVTYGWVRGIIPREEITGDPNLGHDLIEVVVAVEGAEAETLLEDEAADTVLIPYVREIVRAVRPERGTLLIDPPDGLLALIQPRFLPRVVITGLLPPLAESLIRTETSDSSTHP